MKWLTWDQAALIAIVSGILVLLLRRLRPTPIRIVAIPAAIERARQINQLQHNLFFPSELSLQHFILNHAWLARLMDYYYAIAHVGAWAAGVSFGIVAVGIRR